MIERQIILDTETTGLNSKMGHRIIEVGALEMINRQLTGKQFHKYINPQRDIDEGAEAVHGITRDFLKDKPVFKDIIEDFLIFIEGGELIIHNAPFDVGFLDYEFDMCRTVKTHIKTLKDYCTVTDTLTLARRKHPGQKNNLDALCKRYHVDNKDRNLHGALVDAELLAWVYLAMTGGQKQLFDMSMDNEHATVHTVENKIFKQTLREPLKIIFPTEEELQAHETFLNYMEKHYCLPLWNNED